MQERHVTLGKQTLPVPSPFLVMATQNPIQSEGTYPLPDAQLDRFMLKVLVDYPDEAEDELVVIDRALAGAGRGRRDALARGARAPAGDRRCRLRRSRRSCGTRSSSPRRRAIPSASGLTELAAYVEYGVSPRGPINLALAARALAAAARPPLRRSRPTCVELDEGRLPAPARAQLRGDRRRRDARRRARSRARGGAAARASTSSARRWRRERDPAHLAVSGRPIGPGPGPLRAGHLRKLDLTVRRRVDGILVGDHRATTLGDGTELAQVRPYVVGDDVRRIDWNVTARTGRAARALVRRRANGEHLAPARHVGFDDLRHRRPPQVGRGRGGRPRRRSRRRTAWQPKVIDADASSRSRDATACSARRAPARAGRRSRSRSVDLPHVVADDVRPRRLGRFRRRT